MFLQKNVKKLLMNFVPSNFYDLIEYHKIVNCLDGTDKQVTK